MRKNFIATITISIAAFMLFPRPFYALTDAEIVKKLPTLSGYEYLDVDEPIDDCIQMEGRIYQQVLTQFPELVYSAAVSKEILYFSKNATKYVDILQFTPTLIAATKDPEYIKSIQDYITSVIAGANISDTNTNAEKVKKLAHFIGENYIYDFNGADENRKNGISLWRSLTEQGKSFCMMDALLFKGCCDRLEIPCTYIRGYAGEEKPVEHAWNRVFIDGKWTAVDTTWARSAGDDFIFFEFGEERTILYEIE